MNDKNIFNSFSEESKYPTGSVEAGTEVKFNLKFSKTDKIEDVKLIIFPTDDWWYKREEIDMNLSKITNTENFYSCTFTPDVDVYYYFFKLKINGEYKELRRGMCGEAIFAGEENECFQLTSYDKSKNVPDFMKGATFYQIFPDRFNNSNTPKENVPGDRIMHADWNENPIHLPNEKGEIKNDDFFGGDLRGIINKLDYIKSLGVTIIYLNPIFESQSNHRYDTANYMKIDPLLGTEEDFKELCQKANDKGIKIIIDGVFNHSGSDSIYFNKENRYQSVGAYNSKDSMYSDWYRFTNFPNEYESWWDFKTLPKFNQYSKDNEKYIKEVIKYWMDRGASGVRFDVVDEINNDRFYNFSKVVKENGGTTIGEVWEDVSIKEAYGERKHYFTKNTLDSAMNYVYKDALFEFFETKNGEVLLDRLLRVIDNYPKDNLDAMMNIISGHDIERAITRLAKGPSKGDRFWAATNDRLDGYLYEEGKNKLKLISSIQYFLPGNPCLYYGDEAGVYGYKDPFNRKTYPWGREDNDLIEFYKTIGNIRKEEKYLKDAKFIPILFNEGICLFERKSLNTNDSLYVGVNISDNEYNLDFLDTNKVLYGEENNKILTPNKSLILKK